MIKFVAPGVAAGSVLFVASAASAGVIGIAPDLSIELEIGGQSVFLSNPDGVPGESGQFVYQGMDSGQGWELVWDISADADPFIIAGLAVSNLTASTQTFTLTTLLPIAPALPGGTTIGGSVQGGITADSDGGTLGAISPTDPVYRAIIDNAFVGPPAELFVGDSVTVGAFESENISASEDFGAPIPSAPGPPALNNIGIELKFTLSPGDQASFTGVFVVVPTPGGAAMLGALAFGAFARRRR